VELGLLVFEEAVQVQQLSERVRDAHIMLNEVSDKGSQV